MINYQHIINNVLPLHYVPSQSSYPLHPETDTNN